jgi:hypothetical protein
MTNDKIKKALYNIDKWMPEDFELQREYYQLINDKDQKGMEEFLDMYADQDRLMRYGIQYEDLGKLAEAIISGSDYAKGGEMSDKKTILKIQNMMDDERMTLKLQKQFEGKDLFDDEIVDKYDVKQFDYREDSGNIEKFVRIKKNKFYVVPFDNQDDSYYYILVPKDKMTNGGYMADGGRIVSKEKFDKNDENLSEDIYEWSLEYWPQEMEDDIDFTYDLQGSLKENNYEKVIELINEILSGYKILEESKGSSLILKMEKNKKFIKSKANKFDNMTPYEKANKIAEEAFGEFGIGTLEYDDYPKILNMGKANKLAREYGESNFRNLDESDMETILNDNPDILKDYKYADGGYMAKGGMIVAQKTFDINDNEVSEDIYEFLLDYTSDDFELSEEDQYAIRSEDPEKVIDIMNDGLTDYEVVSRYDDDQIRLKIIKKTNMAKGGKLKIGGEDFSYLLKLSDKDLSKRLDLVKKQQDINGKQYFEAKSKNESTQKIEDSRKNLDNQERAIIEARVRKMSDGGMMAKGGKTSDLYYIELNANDPKDKDLKDILRKHNVKMKIISFDKNNNSPFESGEIKLIGEKNDIINVLKNPLTWDADEDDLNEFYLKDIKKMENGGYMAKGGKTKTNPAKFKDKVNAITKKLAGTKVTKKYKKDYGATYDKKEANTAAKRIAGAKLAEVRSKLAKKKK